MNAARKPRVSEVVFDSSVLIAILSASHSIRLCWTSWKMPY
jgi:hypothetical protein